MLANPICDINQTEGIVIRSHHSGDSDLVIKMLSPIYGKISVFAKHARTSKKRFAGNIEILDKGVFYFKNNKGRNGNSLRVVESFHPLKTTYDLRNSLLKLSIASLLCECFDLTIKEDQDLIQTSTEYYETFCLGIQALGESKEKNDLLKVCFLTLKGLLCIAGFLESERAPIPNMKNLRIILDHIENCLEKRLLTRIEFEKLIF